jgi:hypothetical protein
MIHLLCGVAAELSGRFEVAYRAIGWGGKPGTRPLTGLRRALPGGSVENTHVEAFHGTFRRECLSQHWSIGLEEARRTIRDWRDDYNKNRPHSSLGQQTPVAFAGGGDFTEGRIGIQNSQS